MGVTEIVALATMLLAIFAAIGGVVKWAAGKFERQNTKLDRLAADYQALQKEHGLVLVNLQKFRLAFQLVASELARKSPGNHALALAKALLDEAFKIDADIPPEMQAELDKLDSVK